MQPVDFRNEDRGEEANISKKKADRMEVKSNYYSHKHVSIMFGLKGF